MAEPSRTITRRKQATRNNPIPPKELSESERIHFSTTLMARCFQTYFMGHKVIDSYYVNLDDFEELVLYGKSIKDVLESWEVALDIEKRVYLNLVKVFYFNMELSSTRLDRIHTNVREMPIEFNVGDLKMILSTKIVSLEIYTSRKELDFNHFLHIHAVKIGLISITPMFSSL